ncbi:hypothetical protein [Clostridium tunisiense]|uniref:hypothetical protein n=1 Tax=Clostridium tunisiense TaxID=219748 RepID=UPI0002D3440E|nr:hypothetical protein [Clostridium tunisiense]
MSSKKNNTKLYLRYAMLLILIIIFIGYTKYYYGTVNFKILGTNLIICFNIIFQFIYEIIIKLINSLLTENNIKIIIISIVLLYVIRELQLKEILFSITNFEFGNFKVMKKVEMINELNKKEEEKIEKLEKSNGKKNKNEEEIKIIEKKIQLLQIMANDPYTIIILERFFKQKIGSLVIPMNVFSMKTSIENIKEIFDYSIGANSVKILGIKESIRELVYEIYLSLEQEKHN